MLGVLLLLRRCEVCVRILSVLRERQQRGGSGRVLASQVLTSSAATVCRRKAFDSTDPQTGLTLEKYGKDCRNMPTEKSVKQLYSCTKIPTETKSSVGV